MIASFTQKWDEPEFRQRLLAVVISLAVEGLFVLALLTLGLHMEPKIKRPSVATFNVAPVASAMPETSSTESQDAAPKVSQPPIKQPIPPPLLPSQNKLRLPPQTKDFIKVSKEDFAAMDISKFPVGGGAHSKGDAAAPIGPGEGPGGAPLYMPNGCGNPVTPNYPLI